jgi:hypothetical protein
MSPHKLPAARSAAIQLHAPGRENETVFRKWLEAIWETPRN